MTMEETMKVIAEGRCDELCPIIDKIAELCDRGFEIAAETSFERDEDEVIFDLMVRLFAKGMSMEAVDVMAMTFSLIGAEEAFMLVALIASCGRDDVCESFMLSFFEHSKRCLTGRIELPSFDELS